MKHHLLILDNAVYPDIYPPVDHWAPHVPDSFQMTVVRKEEPVPKPDGFSHVIITGSEGSIREWEPWHEDQCDLIREAAKKQVPLLASCHGHQMVVLALAGRVNVRRATQPEFGWVEVELLQADTIFEGATQPAFAFCSHFDEVVNLPADRFRVLAKSMRCSVQAFQVQGSPVFGIQAHPEVDLEEGERMLRDFAPRFPAMADHPVLGPAKDTGLAATIMKNFLAMV